MSKPKMNKTYHHPGYQLKQEPQLL